MKPVEPVSADPAPLPFVTVAIPTYNRSRWLKEMLAFVTRQDYPADRYEVVVVDNNSPDDTRDVVAAFAAATPAPRYFLETKQGSSHARNRLLAEARPDTDIMLFADDDVIGRADWIRLMVAPLREAGHERVAGVCGETIPHFPDGLPPWLEGQFRPFGYRTDSGPLTAKQLPSTANVALWRRVIDEVGHFRTDLGRLPNRLTAGEDNDLMRRILAAGYTFWFEPRADVLHVVPANRLTFKYAMKLQYDAACSRVIERFSHPGGIGWLLSRILLYALQIPFYAVLGLVSFILFQAGAGKRQFTRIGRAAGYVVESARTLKRKALGQRIDVYS
ncbi:MAG TPA: glycosyltransferase [Candidatus Didemnitutus sp.]|jgi:glycosyltransferase involved in cell wall biosynthesis